MALTRRKMIQMASYTTLAGSLRGTEILGAPARQTSPPNILFLMADQWRRQALGFMKQDLVETPNLDKFASQSTACMNALSTVPVCSPNRSCLFSGKYSLNNHVLCNETTLMPDKLTLGEFTKAAGYQTAYLGKWHMGFRKVKGSDISYIPPEIRHGFDHWFVEQTHEPFKQPYYVGDAMARAPITGESWEPDTLAKHAVEYLESRDKAKPFCLVVSFGPPHTGGGPGFEGRFIPGKEFKETGRPTNYGYSAPSEYESLYTPGGKCYNRPLRGNVPEIDDFERSKAIQGYFGALTSIDKAIGRILDTVDSDGLTKNTIVVFLADHGDMMGSHGRFGKDQYYQESSGIPMIYRYPGHIPAGAHYEGVVGSIDVLPTLLGLAGVTSKGLDGTDLSANMRGVKTKQPEFAYGSFFKGGFPEKSRMFRSIASVRYTYALNHGPYLKQFGPEVLFDRSHDPLELNPIKRGMGQDALMDDFKKKLAAHLSDLHDPFIETMWAGGPSGNNPDDSYYANIIASARFPEQSKTEKRGADSPDL